jgi:hypothetical protein
LLRRMNFQTDFPCHFVIRHILSTIIPTNLCISLQNIMPHLPSWSLALAFIHTSCNYNLSFYQFNFHRKKHDLRKGAIRHCIFIWFYGIYICVQYGSNL